MYGICGIKNAMFDYANIVLHMLLAGKQILYKEDGKRIQANMHTNTAGFFSREFLSMMMLLRL